MDFLNNVVKSSNAIIKDKFNTTPFGTKGQQSQSDDQQEPLQPTASTSNQDETNNQDDRQNESTKRSSETPSVDQSEKNSQFSAIAADADAVAQKAVKGAKNIGNFLFSMANKAGQTVQHTAKQVKQAVENTSILTDLTREQQEFIREHGASMQAGELPWSDCPDESKANAIREQVLSLSSDKRNFVRSPPNDADFVFEPKQCYPIALTLLKEDPNLGKMRFELVPKLVNEDTFWRNYFYRVSLLKQMSEKNQDIQRQGWASSRSSSGEGPDEDVTAAEEVTQQDENPSFSLAAQNSSTTDVSNFNADNLMKTQQQGTFDQDISTSAATNLVSSTQDVLQTEESKKLFAEADDLKSRLKELNIGSLDLGDGSNQDG